MYVDPIDPCKFHLIPSMTVKIYQIIITSINAIPYSLKCSLTNELSSYWPLPQLQSRHASTVPHVLHQNANHRSTTKINTTISVSNRSQETSCKGGCTSRPARTHIHTAHMTPISACHADVLLYLLH
jgi:hypothetical protein